MRNNYLKAVTFIIIIQLITLGPNYGPSQIQDHLAEE